MMQYTIIVVDKTAYKDFIPMYDLDVSEIPSDIHAIQFNDDTGLGHIEYINNVKPNEEITALPSWAGPVFNEYDAKKLAIQAALEKAKEQPAADNMQTL